MVFLIAGESFLKIGKASPGMSTRRAFGSDTPEVKEFLALSVSVENELNSEDTGGVEFAALVRLGALEVISGGVVIEN